MNTARYNTDPPPHWKRNRLKFLSRFVGGGTPDKGNVEYWNGDIPWVSPKDMKVSEIVDTEDHLTQAGLDAGAARIIDPGAVLIVVRSGILRHSIPVAINRVPVALNQDMRGLVTDSTLEPRYLVRLIEGHQKQLLNTWSKEGTTVESLESDLIADTEIALPPVAQQRAITDYLDRETAQLDALVAEKKRLLALVAEKRRAIIARAVTRSLDPDAPLRDSGIPWLGKIPAHWAITQLKFASLSLQTGPFGSQLHAEDYVTGGTPVVNPSHLSAGAIHADDRITVHQDAVDRLDRHRLSLGDIVFARRGELGRCAVVEAANVGWLCGTGSLRVRLRKEMADPHYVALVFYETGISDVLTFQSVGSTMDNLNTEILGSCHIAVPPLAEQRAIVAHVATATTYIDSLRSTTERTIALLKERRAALIAAAVTGRLKIPEAA